MGVYDQQIESATRIIDKKGGPVDYFARKAGADLDPEDPSRGKADGTVPFLGIKVVFFPVNSFGRRSASRGENRPVGKEQVLIAATSLPNVTPSTGDSIIRVRQGKTLQYTVDTVDILDVNGETILYTLEVGI